MNGQASAVHHCQPTRITRQQSHANWQLVGLVQAGGRYGRVWGSGGWTVRAALCGSVGPLVQSGEPCLEEFEGGLHGVVGSHERGVGE